ncbi:type II TA system antitoxin MqsA family protein [Aquabacterium sp.]|uniref:type II TA system antitoxin MqsA family protein n=1 Tax=Aquabacterium sp. TaxID=1872578 RepID=UPI0035B24EC1
MKYTHVCPFCEEGNAVEVEYSTRIKLGRRMVVVEGLKKTVCEVCASESVPEELHDVNLALINQAGDVCRGAVSAGMLRALREDWDLTQVDASKLFGAGKSSFAKWESGQAKISTPAALLVQVAMNVPGVMPYLGKLAKMAVRGKLPHGKSPTALPVVVSGAYETVRFPDNVAANVLFFKHRSTHKSYRMATVSDVLREEDWDGIYSPPKKYSPEALVPLEAAA